MLACRNTDSAEAVARELREETGNKNITVLKLDLASLKSVREFVKAFTSQHDHLHILINNAGRPALCQILKTFPRHLHSLNRSQALNA